MFQGIKREFEQGRTLLQFGFLTAVGQALGMIAPLVIAKFFSPELFGSYSLAKMVIFFFTSLLISASQAPFIVFANQERVQTGKINKSFSVQCILLSFAAVIYLLLSLAFNRAVTAFAKISTADLVFMSLAFIGIALQTFLGNLFMALGERMKNAWVEFVFGGLSLLLIFVFYLIGKITLQTVFLIYFISAIFVAAVFIKIIDFKMLLPFYFDREHFREMFNFTKWIMLGASAVYFINWGDNLVLRYFVSMEDIGQYNLGYQIFKGVATLTFIINGYFLPFVSQHTEDKAMMRSYLYDKRPKIFFLGFAGIILFFIIAPYILNLIYSGIYSDSITVLRILLIGSVIILYTTFYMPVFNALKRYKFTQSILLFQVLLNLLLDLLLVPLMGMLGAAVATVIAYFCWAVAVEIYFRAKLTRALNL
jgi:O-antigen/teichoic acid export membrane protein